MENDFLENIGAPNLLSKEEQDEITSKIEEYNSKITDRQLAFSFKNLIRHSGNCGFFGSKVFLVNTDPGNAYDVTVRIYWSTFMEHGFFDKVLSIPAGSFRRIGCTQPDISNEFGFRVVGESKR